MLVMDAHPLRAVSYIAGNTTLSTFVLSARWSSPGPKDEPRITNPPDFLSEGNPHLWTDSAKTHGEEGTRDRREGPLASQ